MTAVAYEEHEIRAWREMRIADIATGRGGDLLLMASPGCAATTSNRVLGIGCRAPATAEAISDAMELPAPSVGRPPRPSNGQRRWVRRSSSFRRASFATTLGLTHSEVQRCGLATRRRFTECSSLAANRPRGGNRPLSPKG
jgi:hypothetical protein